MKNNIIKKLTNHKYSKCKIEIYKMEKYIRFISYETEVVNVVYNEDKNEIYLRLLGHYSKTTSKQVTWFLNEYFSYYKFDIKKFKKCELIIIKDENKTFLKNFE